MLTTVLERGKGLWENAWSGADKCEDLLMMCGVWMSM